MPVIIIIFHCSHTPCILHSSTQNGVKTVEEFENGQLVSKTVNGQAMAVEGGEIPAISIGSKKSSKRTK